MKKMKMKKEKSVTFEEGCDLYLNNCRERNLRQGTVNHYRQSYVQFFKYFDRDMPVKNVNEKMYNIFYFMTKITIFEIYIKKKEAEASLI